MKTEIIKINDNEYLITIWVNDKMSHSYKMFKSDLQKMNNQISVKLKN